MLELDTSPSPPLRLPSTNKLHCTVTVAFPDAQLIVSYELYCVTIFPLSHTHHHRTKWWCYELVVGGGGGFLCACNVGSIAHIIMDGEFKHWSTNVRHHVLLTATRSSNPTETDRHHVTHAHAHNAVPKRLPGEGDVVEGVVVLMMVMAVVVAPTEGVDA